VILLELYDFCLIFGPSFTAVEMLLVCQWWHVVASLPDKHRCPWACVTAWSSQRSHLHCKQLSSLLCVKC